jgi:DNA-binding PucR family transcriptional regulator
VTPGGLRGAVEEARHGLTLGRQRLAGSRGRGVVIAGDEIAAHHLMLANLPDDLRYTLRRRLLGPLEDYDAEHGGDLRHTLAVYLERSCSPSGTAAAMHVHVNTVRYRLGRIEQLLGRDLSSFPDRVDVYLALQIP